MHGMRCTCALKKDPLYPVLESPMNPLTRARSNTDTRKPRLSTTNSDPSIMFASGHHKHVNRHNHAGHDCSPYKIHHRPHSIHGHLGLGQRSMDSLQFRPADNAISHSNDFASVRQDERLVRSAQGSPGLQPVTRLEQFRQLPELDMSYPVFNTSVTSSPVTDDHGYQQYNLIDQYASPSEDTAPPSAPLAMPTVEWHASELPLSTGNYSSTYSHPPSYASFDQGGLSRPALTTSSSGEVSEADEYMTKGVSSPGILDGSPYPTSLGEQGSLGPYSLSKDSFGSMTPPPILSTNLSGGGMDPFMQRPIASPLDLNDLGNGSEIEADLFTRHGITVQEAQKLAHAGSRSEVMGSDFVHTVPRPTSDPLWASAYTEDEGGYSPAGNYPDGTWAS